MKLRGARRPTDNPEQHHITTPEEKQEVKNSLNSIQREVDYMKAWLNTIRIQ